MRYTLSDDLGGDRLPKVGGWVFLVALPLVVVFALAAVVTPLGSGGSRTISIVLQIASARSELLPILIGSQLGVSALVVAITQFQPGRWRGTPKELGACWLSEVRLVASQENRCKAASLGLACISSIVVFGVAACVYQKPDAGGILLLVVVWGVHAVSCIVLIMVPMAGVAAIADYWEVLARLAYVAEMWPEGLREARSEAEVGRPSLIGGLRRWRIVVALLFLGLIMFMVAFWKSTVLAPIRGCIDSVLWDVWQCSRRWSLLRLGTGVGGVGLFFLSFYSGCRSLLCLLKGF